MRAEPSNGHGRNGSAESTTGPASNPDAEAAVLSAILLKPAVLDDVRDLLVPEDFWLGQHRSLFEAIIALDAAQRRIDVVTVRAQLEAMGVLAQVGGSKFLGIITDATPAVANVGEHAKIVHELGALRRAGAVLRELAATAQRAETRADVAGFLERCEQEIFDVGKAAAEHETASTLRELMGDIVRELDGSRPQTRRGLSTGIAELDDLSLGFLPGEVWCIGARPGMGKSSLAMNLAEAVARSGHHVCFFSMEMTRPEISARLVSAMSGVPGKAIHKGDDLGSDALARVIQAAVDLQSYPMIIDDRVHLTPSRLRSRVRRHAARLRAEHPHARLSLVVVDYAQLMAADGGNTRRTKNDELEQISRSLKILAGDFRCTVLVLSQLNRPDPRRASARPTLTDLRGSGAFEQDADKVLLIHREADDAEEAELILAKGRNAGTGSVRVGWEPWCTRFVGRPQERFAWVDPRYGAPESEDGS